jgi:hypothetical protein
MEADLGVDMQLQLLSRGGMTQTGIKCGKLMAGL